MKAPTIGMKPPKNVSTASGSASGTPSTTRPIADEHRVGEADDRLALDEAAEGGPGAGEHDVAGGEPARSPTTPRSQGRKRGPSLMKKKQSTSASAAVTSSEPTALTPVSTPGGERGGAALQPVGEPLHRGVDLGVVEVERRAA